MPGGWGFEFFCNESVSRASYIRKRGENVTDFEPIYEKHFALVYRYLLSLCRSSTLAEELTQECFLKAMEAMEGFDGRCKLSVWLCQIAKNSYFSYLRRQKRAVPAEDFDIPAPDPEQSLLDRERLRQLHRLLHELPEPYKEVFSLRVFGELPFAQIAELFGKTESWARVTFYRAKQKIQEGMQ